MHNLVGFVANIKHCDFVQNLHGTIHATSYTRGEFGRVLNARFSMSTFPNGGKQPTGNWFLLDIEILFNALIMNQILEELGGHPDHTLLDGFHIPQLFELGIAGLTFGLKRR